MTLSLIGAGFGRTGTKSLQTALQMLGLGRCYHMVEVFPDPKAPPFWERAFSGQPVVWDEIFAGYGATVDWPACSFYRELAEHYPHAKILLTVRSSESWWKSVSNTIFVPLALAAAKNPAEANPIERMMKALAKNVFDGNLADRDHCVRVFERHNEEVQRLIPKDRLLVYEASQGWAPLCRFLDRPLPDAPFPSENTTAEFRARIAQLIPPADRPA